MLPQLRLERHQGSPDTVVLNGTWSAVGLASPNAFADLTQQLATASPNAQWDLRAANAFDHLGAQVLWNHWGRRWPAQLQAQEAQRSVLERVARLSQPMPTPPWPGLLHYVGLWGAKLIHQARQVRSVVRLIGQLVLDAIRLARQPSRGPWRELSSHLFHIGLQALPITALVGVLIGIVLAYLTAQQLQPVGADAFIVNILGLGLVRELGPLLAAILVAGRSGSSITAQIGIMRVTEELDAMRVLGMSHSWRLVLPRTLALALAMPLVSLWTTICAMAGGIAAAALTLGITPADFLEALPQAVRVSNLILASAKSVVFGVLIALVACHFGLRVKPNTQSLGESTTASVVTSITVVILINALFAVLFKGIGL